MAKGLYLLLMKLERAKTITVGKLGSFTFEPGFYVYVGSAWGPGGIEARVRRHIRRARQGGGKLHWHLDYLLPHVDELKAISLPGETDECGLADALAAALKAERFPPGFGAGDCRCAGHLLRVSLSEASILGILDSFG